MKLYDEVFPQIITSQEQINKDLKFLERDLARQLKNPVTKEFWDKTLGETLASGKVKMRGDKWNKD